MARLCHNQREIATSLSPFTWLHFLAIFRKAPPNSTPYSFRKKEVRSRLCGGNEKILRSTKAYGFEFTPKKQKTNSAAFEPLVGITGERWRASRGARRITLM